MPTTLTKGTPKKIWVPKENIVVVVDMLVNRKETTVIVPGQWLFTSYEKRKVYVLMPFSHAWWNINSQRESIRSYIWSG